MKIILCLSISIFLMATAVAQESASQRCVELNRIDLDENELLSKNQQKKLFNQYIGDCIDGDLLKAIITDISDFYIKRGNITTKPYLKKQTITDGQIDVSILKGTIEDIVDAATNASNTKIKTAFAFQKGKVLNLRDLETSLEMMNRPPSSDARFEIRPGSKYGASMVDIKSTETYPFHFKIGASGREYLSDNKLELTADFSADNLFNINDILTLRYNGSRVQEEYQSNKGGELNFSFPIASYLMEFVRSDVSYRQGVYGLNDTYLSKGDTKGTRVRISKILMRNQKNKFSAALSVYHKNTKSYFSNQLIDVSSYKTTLAQFDLIHTYLQSWGQLTTTYSYYQGTDWFGARTDDYTSAEINLSSQAMLQFIKHSADINLLYYLNDRSYHVTSNLRFQRTNNMLYDNDKLTVGSDYTVRGYLNTNLYGNNALYIKNDMTKTWPINHNQSLLQRVSISIGIDYGKVECEADNQSSCGETYGTAVGISTQANNLSTSFVWSKPLKKIDENHELKGLFKFDVTWKF